MAVNDFLLAFVRFTKQFGVPDELYSDNAKTFVSGAFLLSNLITSSEFHFFFYNFITFVLEAPKIINSRALTYCSREHTADAVTLNLLVYPGRSAPSVIINKEHAEYAWELDEEEHRLALLHTLECRDTLWWQSEHPPFLESVLSIVTTNRNYRNTKHIKETLNIKYYLGTLCINKSYCKW